MNLVKFGSFFGFQHKFWELQVCNTMETSWFKVSIDWTRKVDHAGFYFVFECYHFFINFMIYDSRHWDYDTDDYL